MLTCSLTAKRDSMGNDVDEFLNMNNIKQYSRFEAGFPGEILPLHKLESSLRII